MTSNASAEAHRLLPRPLLIAVTLLLLVLVLVPVLILFLFAQKSFVRGITFTGVKG